MFKDEKIVLDRLSSDDNVLNIINGENNTTENIEEKDPCLVPSLEEILEQPAKLGRPAGARERSYEDRTEIAVLSDVIGPIATSKILNVSTAATSNHRNGKINHYDKKKNKTLEKMIGKRKDTIRNLATKQIEKVLETIDEQTIENLRGNAIKSTTVAMNLSRIVEKLEPKEKVQNNLANFIIMQPTVAQEHEYETIDV